MKRRAFLKLSALTSASVACSACAAVRGQSRGLNRSDSAGEFELSELSIPELQQGMTSGRFTVVGLVRKYLERVEKVDRRGPGLRAVMEINPEALAIARELDRERKARGPRGPLHGIPVLLKDNIDTQDRMSCTAGSLSLEGSHPPRDAFLTKKLRQAGAVILGKTNLSEWANFRSTHSTSGWSARGGLTRNPYALDRNPSGSSSGSAVAVSANLCAVAVGTETNGSILSPSSYNGVVGLKPTVGLISRSGIIPISHTQDTAGPMGRSVLDTAILLGCLAGADPQDPPTQQAGAHSDYAGFLDEHGLRGARLGVARHYFGSHAEANKIVEEALEEMKRLGATLVDPVENRNWSKLGQSYQVMLYEFKAGLNAYLEKLGSGAPVRSLEEIIAFNERNRDKEMPYFGQEIFIQAQAKGPLSDGAYREHLEVCQRLSRTEGIDATLSQHQLDAIVAPTTGPAHVTDLVHGDRDTGGSTTAAAVAGYPSITVPAGYVSGLPVGISFFGRAWGEPTLLKLAYAFEQARGRRRPPDFRAHAMS